jgi:hypothetical protein
MSKKTQNVKRGKSVSKSNIPEKKWGHDANKCVVIGRRIQLMIVALDQLTPRGEIRKNTLTVSISVFFLPDGNENRIARNENEWDIIG